MKMRTMTASFVAGAVVVGGIAALPGASASASTASVTSASATTTRNADVDGDGKADRITVASVPAKGRPYRYRVTVKTAAGRTASVIHEAEGRVYEKSPLVAVAGIDGAPGAELVMSDGQGPHTWWKRVYTWRKRRMVLQNSPDRHDPGWFTDGQAAGWRFFTRSGTRFVERTVTNAGSPSDPRYRGSRTLYQWRSGRWQQVKTTPVAMRYDSKEFWDSVGWHGLGSMFW